MAFQPSTLGNTSTQMAKKIKHPPMIGAFWAFGGFLATWSAGWGRSPGGVEFNLGKFQSSLRKNCWEKGMCNKKWFSCQDICLPIGSNEGQVTGFFLQKKLLRNLQLVASHGRPTARHQPATRPWLRPMSLRILPLSCLYLSGPRVTLHS